MSLILDALNKSDRDAKDYGAAPSIDAHHPLGGNRADLTKNILLGVIALLILVAVILLATIAFDSPDPTAASQTPSPPVAQTTINTPPMEIATAPTLPQQTDTPVKQPAPKLESARTNSNATKVPSADISALYQTDVNNEEIPLNTPKVVTPSSTSSISAEEQALAQALWDKSKIQSLPKPTEPSAKAATTEQESNPEHSIHNAEDVPFLHRLPVSFQNSIPSLMYAQHSFAEGYIIINKKRLNIGDFAAEGVAIEEILEDGTIFSFKDKRFKLSAQSSWVNY